MNGLFFTLPPAKRRRILSAAFRVFSLNPYKKAPMAEIAAEAGVSKALLFYYFANKKELYFFLWRTALDQIRLASREYRVAEAGDLFEMLRRSLLAKCAVLRSQPWLYRFSLRAYYEPEPEIAAGILQSFAAESRACEAALLARLDCTTLRLDVDPALLYRELVWLSDGYLRQQMLAGQLDADQMEQDFMGMVAQWRTVYSAAGGSQG